MTVADLTDIPRIVAELTLEEKASLCSGSDFWHTQGIDRFGIPAVMLTDGPHGLRKQAGETDHLGLNDSVPATCFPSAAGLGSTWDRDLLRRVGEALGAETRANDVAVLLGPGINMKRTPLCGRNFEYFSEDPYLTGELAAPLVAGIQSQGVGTSLKHFAANNQETDRMRVSVEVDERTLREIYLPAFEAVVTRAHPWTVMCAYNKINGTYASQDRWLLTEVLRDEWGFEGLVVSDWGAVDDRAAGVAAGLDLEMPSSNGVNDAKILEAVRSGSLAEADLDAAVTRVLTLVARSQQPGPEPIPCDLQANHALAHEVATRTAVLLKNDGVLPLEPAELTSTAVVIGEMARTPRYQGAGSSQVNPTRLVSALDALAERGLDVPFAPGYHLAEAADATVANRSEEELRREAALLATGRTAVLFLGLPAADESEGYDREHLDLPTSHVALLRAVAEVAEHVVVLLSNGSAVAVADWEEQADAILELWLGGQAGGSAAVDLLVGDAAPSGRLAESMPQRLVDVPAQLSFPGEAGSVHYGERVFIGYRGLDAVEARVSYPFGHGLTYTSFEYSDLSVEVAPVNPQTRDHDVVLQARATVTNTGERTGVVVPQLYVGRPGSALARAPRELRGFDRLELAPGASGQVEFALTRRDLSHWDAREHGWALEPGTVVVSLGSSSRDLPLVHIVQLEAPPLRRPLTDHSTIGEWMEHPEAGAALRAAMGEAGALFGADSSDPMMATFLMSMPVVKVPLMSMIDSVTLDDLEELLARYGGR
ncbi:glycoside hydrolase family 3 N-terminal domain-containing protein [Intrasporangium sp.]|uniref:glycoside hydrolase family 3 N-terminal domain-containing protein n=1 Tax=Intrasporangium sp. TaxID=1925024 RepID=UPI003221826C